jgi:hypothetical protein
MTNSLLSRFERTYNMQDEQFAFHRALRSEEVRIQFRGDALDLSEFENVEVSPREITIIPLGISTATAVRLGTFRTTGTILSLSLQELTRGCVLA